MLIHSYKVEIPFFDNEDEFILHATFDIMPPVAKSIHSAECPDDLEPELKVCETHIKQENRHIETDTMYDDLDLKAVILANSNLWVELEQPELLF